MTKTVRGISASLLISELGSNATLRKYTWGLDLSRTIHRSGGIGGLLACVETGGSHEGSYWYLYDANGNVGQVIDASDYSIAARYEYDPYGNEVDPDLAPPDPYDDINPFRFSTKWLDTELAGENVNGAIGNTGLYYFGYRYYSPRLGRWLNWDPLAELGGLNLYVYGESNPINGIDPMGLNKGYVCCLHFTHAFEIRNFQSPHACAMASLQGLWFMDILNGLILSGCIIFSDYGITVICGEGATLGPLGLAALAALESAYVVALNECMSEICVRGYAATRTVTVRPFCPDKICYSCPNGGVITDPGKAYADGKTPTETKKCHLSWFD